MDNNQALEQYRQRAIKLLKGGNLILEKQEDRWLLKRRAKISKVYGSFADLREVERFVGEFNL